jgi:T-complex protein 1 subunit alpha
MAIKVDKLGDDVLVNCCKTCMSSKLIGSESDFFAKMVMDSIERVKVFDAKKRPKFPINAINIV